MTNQNRDQLVSKEAPSTLEEMLAYLNLQESLGGYREVLAQSAKDNVSHEEFLKRLLSRETAAKVTRVIDSRLAQARFPFIKTLEQFDWNHPTSIPKAKILAAGDLSFLNNREGYVFIAEHGLGKTHLAIGIGQKAVQAGVPSPLTSFDHPLLIRIDQPNR